MMNLNELVDAAKELCKNIPSTHTASTPEREVLRMMFVSIERILKEQQDKEIRRVQRNEKEV